ncbi:MAG: hypothetical protein H6860_06440 [Rhodospirillales bacterium]|nr:hypothetical protein [Rhodospirillales bacterium]
MPAKKKDKAEEYTKAAFFSFLEERTGKLRPRWAESVWNFAKREGASMKNENRWGDFVEQFNNARGVSTPPNRMAAGAHISNMQYCK